MRYRGDERRVRFGAYVGGRGYGIRIERGRVSVVVREERRGENGGQRTPAIRIWRRRRSCGCNARCRCGISGDIWLESSVHTDASRRIRVVVIGVGNYLMEEEFMVSMEGSVYEAGWGPRGNIEARVVNMDLKWAAGLGVRGGGGAERRTSGWRRNCNEHASYVDVVDRVVEKEDVVLRQSYKPESCGLELVGLAVVGPEIESSPGAPSQDHSTTSKLDRFRIRVTTWSKLLNQDLPSTPPNPEYSLDLQRKCRGDPSAMAEIGVHQVRFKYHEGCIRGLLGRCEIAIMCFESNKHVKRRRKLADLQSTVSTLWQKREIIEEKQKQLKLKEDDGFLCSKDVCRFLVLCSILLSTVLETTGSFKALCYTVCSKSCGAMRRRIRRRLRREGETRFVEHESLKNTRHGTRLGSEASRRETKDEIMRYFDVDLTVRKLVMNRLGQLLRNFKTKLRRTYILPNQDTPSKLNEVPTKYTAILKAEEWVNFVKYTATQAYKVKSAAGKMARSKCLYPHTMGRGGYAHVKEQMIEKKEIEQDEEPTRGTLWLKGRVNKDGEYQDDEIRSVGDKLKETEDKIKEGTLQVDQGTDAMTLVLGKEKGGYARGVGSGVTYKRYFDLPRSKQAADERILLLESQLDAARREREEKELLIKSVSGGHSSINSSADEEGGTTVLGCDQNDASIRKEMQKRKLLNRGAKRTTRSIRKDSSSQDSQSKENVSVLPQ
ncbi:transposase, Ptta/En/Spm, transposase, Tnp1/En/Spm-like protein, partial [Tanacetum coccineum]